METKTILSIAQIAAAIGVVVTILLQSRGEGIGALFGGGGEVFRTRRGIENVLFYISVGLSVLLVILSLVNTKLT